MENFQQVHLKRAPLQMFPKNIGAAHENLNIFYKTFYADAQTFEWPFRSFTLTKSCCSKSISKSMARSLLRPHTFLYKLNTSGVKIRPVFKKLTIDCFYKAENVKS